MVIRDAGAGELDAILQLLPRLAQFELPSRRQPEELWHGDADLLRRWAAGQAPQCLVRVAEGADGIVGVAVTQLRPELLSGSPSAHLEVLVVGGDAEGRGIGRALVRDAEACAAAHGAHSITLHVFNANTRARRLYESEGYDAELLRYIKDLPSTGEASGTSRP